MLLSKSRMSEDSVSWGEFMLEPPSAFDDHIWATPFYCFEFYMGCQSVLLPMPLTMPRGLWVEQAQIRHIPQISHVLIGLRVLQPISSSFDHFEDYVGSFPLWGELVYFFML